jgi:FkbM family methyltransferase
VSVLLPAGSKFCTIEPPQEDIMPYARYGNLNEHHFFRQIVSRSWPFKIGKGHVLRVAARGLKLNGPVVKVKTTDGFPMQVNPNDFIGKHIYLAGEFDRSVVETLLKRARPGDTLLDIGANIGYISACFLHNIPDSKVIVVEPQPKVLDLLRANLNYFDGARHELFPIAISNVDSCGWLALNDWNNGAAAVTTERRSNSAAIQLWSAKTLFAAMKGQKVDLVKVDVEGHEETVLRECEADLTRLKPRAILFENQTALAAPSKSLGGIFRRMGYRVYGLRKGMTKVSLAPIATARDCVYNDYLAVRE